MRDIKFRAWVKENRCMVYQEEMNGYIENKQYWFSLSETAVELNVFDEDYKAYVQADADIMEYTGLKDINGTEIYEGDILKEKHYKYSNKPPKKSYGVIKREEGNCNMYVEWNFQDRYEGEVFWNKDRLSLRCAHQYEVIGNIYENSELLVNQMKRVIE